MIEDGTGEDESVEESDRDANRGAFFQLAQHAASGRAVDVEVRVFAAVGSRDDERLAINSESYVAEKCFVENAGNLFAVIDATVRFADDTRPRGGDLIFRH